MFSVHMSHVCTIEHTNSRSFLPVLPPNASRFSRFKRFLKKLILITESNPNCTEFFRTTAEILDERKKQVKSNSWIIHPFSTFRLFYEMYMAVGILATLIYLSLDAAYKTPMGAMLSFSFTINLVNLIDIFVNFTTGYRSTKDEKIVMNCCAIARNYIFSIYFIGDLVSVLPKLPQYVASERTITLIDLISLAKIVRIFTYIHYANTFFSFFRIKKIVQLVVQLLILVLLLIHYIACLFPLLAQGHHLFSEKMSHKQMIKINLHVIIDEKYWDSFSIYIRNVYVACSYILGVDIRFKRGLPWTFYITGIVFYFVGKFLLTFGTVIVLDLLKSANSLEIKYFAMMSQVDAYMKAKKFPIVVQKRLREYYFYKFRQKYFKEHGIKNFLSEKLKKEINYHTCRKLVNNVQIFQGLPREVVEEILHYLKPEVFLPHDIIVKAGSEGDCMYFLASGTVEVLSPSGKEICHLEDGDYFGEICLLVSNLKRTANVIAIEISEVYKLDRKSFKKSMESNLDLFKKMQTDARKRFRETHEIERMFIKGANTTTENKIQAAMFTKQNL